MGQETVEMLEITGHFLHHTMPLFGFISLVLIHFLLIKKEGKEMWGKTEGLCLLYVSFTVNALQNFYYVVKFHARDNLNIDI